MTKINSCSTNSTYLHRDLSKASRALRLTLRKMPLFAVFGLICSLCACASSRSNSSAGGELVGAHLVSWQEPTPYGMVLIPRGSIVLGHTEADSLWGFPAESKAISVDAFWMDRTEITNAQYRQFVYYVRDSIIRERLADPAFGGNPDYKITTDKYGDPITPYLDWSRPLPNLKKALDEEIAAMNSVYYTNPVTLDKQLDPNQMLYKYERYDYHLAALYRNEVLALQRGTPEEVFGERERPIIAKDTAYIDDNGRVLRLTLTRPLTSEYDFLNTYIVPIYPDEASWVRDFPNSTNAEYTKLYFNHPGYDNYPVVGVTWEQAQAFCAWRSDSFRKGMNVPDGVVIEEFRLPTEAEWEYAARQGDSNRRYPWSAQDMESESGCYLGNFKPAEGNYTADGHLITSQVSSFSPNDFGLYDMAGNVAEWTASAYSASSYKEVDDINPELDYKADRNDPILLKRKVVRGGSWKDVSRFVQSATRSYEQQDKPRSYIGFRCVRRAVSFTPAKAPKAKKRK